jgi:pullulanase
MKIPNMKRFLSLCLAALLLIASFPVASMAETTETIIIHYHRSDGVYDDWDIWAWVTNGAGHAFTRENSFGMVAEFTISGVDSSVGFLVRRGGDSWAEKEFDDRFIDLRIGNEIWVISGQNAFFYEAPEGYAEVIEFDELEIIVYRDRYDGR